MKATTYLGLGSSLVIALISVACATGTQDQTGDHPLSDPNNDSGQQGIDDSEAGSLSDEGGNVVKPKNPDAGGNDPQDASSGTDASSDAGVDSGTDSGGPKPDAGCKVTTENLLVNGNLDTAVAPWVYSSAGVRDTPPDLPITPQTGTYAAWLGGAPNANDSMYQAVAMPANATAAHFKGYRWIGTTDIPNADHLSLQTRTSGGTKLEELVNLSPGTSDSKWVAFDYALPNVHAGQSIQIAVIGTTDGSFNTNFFIDSLDLEVTYCKY